TYAERGEKLDYAEKLIRRALEIEPGSGYIIDSLGWVYYQKGDIENALKYLTEAVKLEPQDPSIIEHLGDAYHKKGNNPLAKINYNKALDILYSNKDLSVELNDLEQRLKEKVKEIELNEV
ncbi:MAG: tetratricopeptide repeat protein, partial [Thermodesulfobacteriota bacterium]